MITFAVYAIISSYWKHETLLSAQAFTSVALISLLTTPVIVFIQAWPTVIQCKGCFDRIQEYCSYFASSTEGHVKSLFPCENETNVNSSHELHDFPCPDRDNCCGQGGSWIYFGAKTLAWDKTSPPILNDIDLSIQRSAVNVLIGPIGSGKTALMLSLLREMFPTSTSGISTQSRRRIESIAYCAQYPWLENKTIRQNIVGILPYDGNWYGMVKWACGLDLDISQLDGRDETRVGSKGLSLSGGQKQRIVSLNASVEP